MSFGGNAFADAPNTADEYPDYVPTHDELLELVRYWDEEALRITYSWLKTGICPEWECSRLDFARDRVRRISDLLGEAALAGVAEAVWEEFENRIDRLDDGWQTDPDLPDEACEPIPNVVAISGPTPAPEGRRGHARQCLVLPLEMTPRGVVHWL